MAENSRTPSGSPRLTAAATTPTTGVISTLNSPALAAGTSVEDTGLIPVVTVGDSVAQRIDEQAAAQKEAARRKAAEEAARKKAAEKARADREARARAAREAERKRLNTFVPPIAGSYISTGYRTGGSRGRTEISGMVPQ